MKFFRLLCSGSVIHLIFFLAVFDIYFKSPLLTDLTAVRNSVNSPGKRVALFSVDGLRFDSLFDKDPETGNHVAEYIMNVMQNKASWGVSESHIPTETRPGHIAMLAGFYEDPSAIMRGWKENPVNFDSIFNQSYCSYSWGSPEILQIFHKDLKHDCAYTMSYAKDQDFAGDTKEYDNWVYENFTEFIKSSKHSTSLHDEGIFFFFHLLGQDTSGHKDKPHSEQYRENLKNVDNIIKKIENLFYEFYGDDKTTFIITSDHGMTDWGSHGAGDDDEVNTPFVAWGAGIRKPADPSRQINIDQADIVPLLAVLLHSPIPVNSIGILPVPYLNMSKRQISEAMLLNAKQISAQYVKALQNRREQTFSWFFFPFEKLTIQDLDLKIDLIKNSIKLEKYTEAIESCKILINLCLEGLDYFHNYFQLPLLVCISAGYVAWELILLLELFGQEDKLRYSEKPNISYGFSVIVVISLAFLAFQHLPFSFYSYVLLPEFLWYVVIKKGLKLYPKIRNLNVATCTFFLLSVIIGVEILVFSFFYQWLLFISVGIILVWSIPFIYHKSNKFLLGFWLFSAVALGLFSHLPAIGDQPKPLLLFSSGVALSVIFLFGCWYVQHKNVFLFSIQLFILILSTLNSYSVHKSFSQTQEVTFISQFLSWFLCALSIPIPYMGKTELFQRLHQIFLSFSVPFLLLSITYEGFFLLFLFIHLFCWIFTESFMFNESDSISDFRISYFFLSYIILSFFGLGNFASINSFDPAWTRCFITRFAPFVMGILLLLKTFIPFLIVSCTLRAITVILNIPPAKLFVIVLIYCNLMGFNFLYFIKNKGSWFDIGTSLSHYVILQLMTLFLVLLYGVAEVLTTFKLNSTEKEKYLDRVTMGRRRTSLPTFVPSLKLHKL